ncbi:tetratricopeptide repeat protein [Psychrobacter sp. TAE2020]|uniref:tetratricopeptide repeat protein n=1 Tax=Psychrobacter sp. TAE2020 TaxID=2846762 RepID=UPI001E53BCA8|nr:tetratricopeptide repeat protein [Psychrobacter sp. TAE2020]
MQSLKNIVINAAMSLTLLFGLTVSAAAAGSSFEQVEALSEQGDSFYQDYLGDHYSGGRGVRQDYGKAFEWYQKSAKQNNPFAQGYIGIMYETGRGIRQNKTTAKEWYGKSCDNGEQLGCDQYKKLNEQGY